MESHRAAGKQCIPPLTLETYLNLMHLDVIAPSALRKIISMHGFIGNKVPKKDLLDAVRSIDLMDVHRSTLQTGGVSSQAFLSLKDVINDVSVLHWQECCITSIQTINSPNDFHFESSPKRLKPVSCLASSSENIDNEAAGNGPNNGLRKKRPPGRFDDSSIIGGTQSYQRE